jgi:hypothetical protein
MQSQVEIMKAAVWAAFERGELTDNQATLELLRIDRAARGGAHPNGIMSLNGWHHERPGLRRGRRAA